MSVKLTNEIHAIQSARAPFNVLDPSNYGLEFYALNLFTSEAYARVHPDVVRAFRQASDCGWTYALEHPEEIVDLILKKYNSQGRNRATLLFEARETTRMVLSKVYSVGSIDAEKLRHQAELFVQTGRPPSIERLDGLLLDAAAKPETPSLLDLDAEERAFLKAHPVLRVSNDQEWPGFSFLPRRPDGGRGLQFRVHAHLRPGCT